ncbi:MAG: RcpC/CpaB family pilus assembly protein [Actinomycetota bacterium]|nr:RcpC/CpaB family pilus assembly protein [Actinomycetota bacterium]
MKRRIASVALAVVCAALGTLLLAAYVRGAGAERAGDTVLALVTTRAFDAGTTSTDMRTGVAVEEVPATAAPDDRLISPEQLGPGLVISAPLGAREMVTRRVLVDPALVDDGAPGNDILAVDAPPELVQVTLALSPQRALGGRIRPGAEVTVLVSFDESAVALAPEGAGAAGVQATSSSAALFQGVLVTSVQSNALPSVDGATSAPESVTLVTLAVRPDQADELVYAAEYGKPWLAAESGLALPGESVDVLGDGG